MKESERVYAMKQHFMDLHKNGHSISEIASEYHLSSKSVYNHLQEIADENNCTREELLQIIRITPMFWKSNAHQAHLKFDDLNRELSAVSDRIDIAMSAINSVITEVSTNGNQF